MANAKPRRAGPRKKIVGRFKLNPVTAKNAGTMVVVLECKHAVIGYPSNFKYGGTACGLCAAGIGSTEDVKQLQARIRYLEKKLNMTATSASTSKVYPLTEKPTERTTG